MLDENWTDWRLVELPLLAVDDVEEIHEFLLLSLEEDTDVLRLDIDDKPLLLDTEDKDESLPF